MPKRPRKVVINLPLKHKNKILSFVRDFDRLAEVRTIEITLPSLKIDAEILWQSDKSIDFFSNPLRYIDKEDLKECKEIKKEELAIKTFCDRVAIFGRKYFDDSDWVWDKVLWLYRPEKGQTFPINNVNWE